MNFIEVTDENGKKIFINKAHITSIAPTGSGDGLSIVHGGIGRTVVKASVDEVMSLVEGSLPQCNPSIAEVDLVSDQTVIGERPLRTSGGVELQRTVQAFWQGSQFTAFSRHNFRFRLMVEGVTAFNELPTETYANAGVAVGNPKVWSVTPPGIWRSIVIVDPLLVRNMGRDYRIYHPIAVNEWDAWTMLAVVYLINWEIERLS